MVDIINIPPGNGLVLRVTVGDGDQFIGEHGLDGLAVHQPVNFSEVLNFVEVGFDSSVAGADL